MQNSPKVSVIIPVYNGEATVRDCLNSVLAQDFNDYEVIVVDSSNDESFKIIEQEFPGVKLYHFNRKKSCGEARNIGIEKSRGDYLFFTDIDCLVKRDWIPGVIKLFKKDKELKGLCSSVDDYSADSIIERINYLLRFYRWLPCQKRVENARYLVGACSVYKRELFLDNNYDEGGAYGEDILFSLDMAGRGHKLLFEPSVRVTHINIKRRLSHLIRHQIKVGREAAVIRKKAERGLKIFLKFPMLIFITPFYTVPRMGLTYLIREDFANFWFFLRFFPLFFIGNLFWAAGFFKEAVS